MLAGAQRKEDVCRKAVAARRGLILILTAQTYDGPDAPSVYTLSMPRKAIETDTMREHVRARFQEIVSGIELDCNVKVWYLDECSDCTRLLIGGECYNQECVRNKPSVEGDQG
jgi:hypothetical protein